MNAAVMLMCVAGSVTAGQANDVVFQAPKIQLKRQSSFVDDRQFPYHTLIYNRINIGTNFLKPPKREDYGNPELDRSRLATTYFHREGPMGVVMERYNWFPGKPNTFHADARLPASLIAATGLDPCGQLGQLVNLWSEPPIAVVDIDVGSMASYARPGQTLHYFEPVSAMVKMSFPDEGKEPLFHLVPDALARGANVKVFEGEPRAMLEKHGGAGFYQVIVVNTYKLPVVTVHKELMTKEGMQMLMGKSREDGILCFHTSSRYYKLADIVGSVADELKYACLVGRDINDDHERGHFTSEWVMVARDRKYLAHLKAPPGYDQAIRLRNRLDPYWSPPKHTGKKFVWTDKGENPFRGVYRADPTIGEFGNSLRDFEILVSERLGFVGIHKYMFPVYNWINKWAALRAETLNREPSESRKIIENKGAPKPKEENAPKK
jgi:hypothetical protein